MNNPPESIDSALCNVRKAYRLLHDYQRTARDAANFIGKRLGLNYEGGWAKFSQACPRGTEDKFGKWSWDFLNMVFFEFHFSLTTEPYLFSLVLISDTGYFCSEDPNCDQTDVSAFLPAEKSSTMVGFILWRKWTEPLFLYDKAAMQAFIQPGGDLPEQYLKDGHLGRCVNFDRLVTPESTDALIDDLVVWANKAGFPLKRVDHST